MSKYSNNDENMGIDERARSCTPYNIMSIDLFPIVIRDGVIELNKQQVCLSSFLYDSRLTILRFL
jgi:hypothetical protein